MMNLRGISELCGRKGSGRTNLALYESCMHNTLYISSVSFPIRRYLQMRMHASACDKKLLVAEPHSTRDLWFLVRHKLSECVADEAVELVVVDSLDHLLQTEERRKELYEMLVEIVRVLKNLVHARGIRVLILNSWQPSRKVGAGEWSLGLSWSYLVNTRILVRRTPGRRVCETLISVTGDKPSWCFVINDTGVVFLHEHAHGDSLSACGSAPRLGL